MKEQILLFFRANLDHIEPDSTSGTLITLPAFELTPRDFVAFAEKDLEGEILSSHKLVNATSNLKRAVDCQLDFLLCFLNLDELYRKKRLGVDRKLGFLKSAGVFNARSLEKLNKFRNRLEHHYEIPNIEDVNVYFDVVSAFVSIGENMISNLMSVSEISYFFFGEQDGLAINSCINFSKPSIKLVLGNSENKLIFEVSLEKNIKPKVENIQDFALLLRAHVLLIHMYNGAITNARFIADLEKEI